MVTRASRALSGGSAEGAGIQHPKKYSVRKENKQTNKITCVQWLFLRLNLHFSYHCVKVQVGPWTGRSPPCLCVSGWVPFVDSRACRSKSNWKHWAII